MQIGLRCVLQAWAPAGEKKKRAHLYRDLKSEDAGAYRLENRPMSTMRIVPAVKIMKEPHKRAETRLRKYTRRISPPICSAIICMEYGTNHAMVVVLFGGVE